MVTLSTAMRLQFAAFERPSGGVSDVENQDFIRYDPIVDAIGKKSRKDHTRIELVGALSRLREVGQPRDNLFDQGNNVSRSCRIKLSDIKCE